MMIRIGLAALAIAVLGSFAAACGSDEQSDLTLYLKHDVGTAAPPGQAAPVLAPVRRLVGGRSRTPAEVLALLRRGPTSDELNEGFLPTIPDSVRILNVSESDGTVTVDFAGSEPQDFYTHAATVLSLTELAGVRAVALRYNGQPCCVYNQQGNVITPVTRTLYRGWPGEPCGLRTYPDAVRCRGDAQSAAPSPA
jgi:Sporulation and spore germination